MGTNKLKREMTHMLAAEECKVLEIEVSPHLKFRCRNPHGVEFVYICGCSPSSQFEKNARTIIRKLARLTTPQTGARL